MNTSHDTENARARHEAASSSASATSADRQRLWAGLNRYLASELERSAAPDRDAAQSDPEAEDGKD